VHPLATLHTLAVHPVATRRSGRKTHDGPRVANRNIGVWHGATGIKRGKALKFRAVRIALQVDTGYTLGQGNRLKSRNGGVSSSPTRISTRSIRNLYIALRREFSGGRTSRSAAAEQRSRSLNTVAMFRSASLFFHRVTQGG
jgi:hypothetical protein